MQGPHTGLRKGRSCLFLVEFCELILEEKNKMGLIHLWLTKTKSPVDLENLVAVYLEEMAEIY